MLIFLSLLPLGILRVRVRDTWMKWQAGFLPDFIAFLTSMTVFGSCRDR